MFVVLCVFRVRQCHPQKPLSEQKPLPHPKLLLLNGPETGGGGRVGSKVLSAVQVALLTVYDMKNGALLIAQLRYHYCLAA